MMRKLDGILKGNNQENRGCPMEDSRQATNGPRTHCHGEASLRSRTSFGPSHRERPRAAPSMAWTNPTMPEADATSVARLPTGPQVRSEPDFTTISHDTTMYASMFEPLSRSPETFNTKLSKSTERGERLRRTFKKPKSYKEESDGCNDTWIEVMNLDFEEENLYKKQECSALTSNLEGTALSCVMAKRTKERQCSQNLRHFAESFRLGCIAASVHGEI